MPAPSTALATHPVPAGLRARLTAALRARPRLAAGVAIAAAAVLPLLRALDNPPFLDDGWTALQNPLVWKLENAGRIFRELYGFAGPPSVRGPYRPLTTLSYALDYAVHGPWIPGFHAVNLALHAVASLLVAALAHRLARAAVPPLAGRVAVLAGLLFAVHPAHVEAVVTIFGRTEPLSAAFSLAALLLALRARGPLGVAGAALVLTAGVLSKEVAVMVPPLYLLVAWALPAAAGLPARPGPRAGLPRAALVRTALVAGALSLAFLPYYVGHAVASPQGASLAVAPEARWFKLGTPPLHIALTMSRVLGEYLRVLVFPSFLGGDFAYAARLPTLTAPTLAFAAATLSWLLMLGAGVVLLRRAPLLGIGVLWTFIALLPVMQVLIPVGVLFAERLLYLPSAGACIAAAGALALLPGTLPAGAARRAALLLLPAAIVGLLAARTVARTLDWRSEVAFWESEVAKAPDEVVVNNNLAVAYTARGEPLRAIPHLEAVLRKDPRYWRAWVNLGVALGEVGDLPRARPCFQRAIELAPTESDPLRFLGRTLYAAGDLSEATEAFLRARRVAPEQAVLARELGGLLLRAGRVEEARAQLEDAVRLDPADQASRNMLEKLGPP